ncbi:MAG: sigma-54-dependent Fis family transcriptional regulator [Myxococcales bacterium]|nr:MAG: sigma-54-dependent Fis family transcriptional regulator [Myxococcales bacterium]
MTTGAKILVIDDERPVCISCKRILEEEGHKVDYQMSGQEGVKAAVAGDYEIVLLDLRMPDMGGLDVLEVLRRERPDLTVVIITGYATIQTSIEAIKKGAFDYVPKPFTPEELALAVSKALEDRRLRAENEYLRRQLSEMRQGARIIGRSKAIEDVERQILKIAPTDFTVMVYGESGTGKELVAQAIHENSARRERPFVAVDLSALTPTLIESELFGHAKGAFTGATASKPGYFSLAHGGTLFLDEVSNISYELQGKLLRVLESRSVQPVGGQTAREVDVRVVAATNKALDAMVEGGTFREDLYYRLNVIPLTLPPLRERTDDIPMLAMHFLAKAAEEAHKATRGFTTEAMAKLVSYGWPGNVRQLKNVCERLVATAEAELVGVEQLPAEISGGTISVDLGSDAVPQTADELKEVKRKLKDMVYAQVEKDFLIDALNRTGWNVTKAAELVGMLRPNFHALMRKYGVKTREEG